MKVTKNLLRQIFKEHIRILNENVLGQMPYRYVNLVDKWLSMRKKNSPETLNKLVAYLERTEKSMAIKYLTRMAKELKNRKDQQDFVLSDEWQEVPKDTIMPPGVEYKMDLAGEKTYARRIKL